MANVEQRLWISSKYRYSIKQLLALSRSEHPSFDLSKFTFDAARAGVIPSLGDCAIPSRKSSATRRHVSSEDSVYAMNSTTSSANTNPVKPKHEPQPPPPTALAQHNTGFARFLKKHTSPTHQRVTAGGRIVPMESRAPPPPFDLVVNHRNNLPDGEEALDKQQNSLPTPIVPNCGTYPVTTCEANAYTLPVPLVQLFSKEDRVSNGWASFVSGQALGNLKPTALSSVAVPDEVRQYPVLNAASNVPTFCSDFLPGNTSAYPLWQSFCPGPPTVTYPQPGTWLYDGAMETKMPAVTASSNHLAQPILWAQNALSEWTCRYDELDLQLKALDRHRAMTNLTSEIAVQRREIVQQRANSKNMINLISTWLNLSQHVQPGVTFSPSTTNFNVDAPTYTPMSQRHPRIDSGMTYPGNQEGISSTPVFSRLPTRPIRRPIPIVPPPRPETHTNPPGGNRTISQNGSSCSEVEPWFTNPDPAPPNLGQDQSHPNRSISDVHSHGSTHNTAMETSQPTSGDTVPRVVAKTRYGSGVQGTQQDHHSEDVTVSAPSDIETIYEESLDALRKPKGIITTIAMPDGYRVQIEGQDLYHPKTTIMSSFEREYWCRKPMTVPPTAPEGQCAKSAPADRFTTPVHQPLSPCTPKSSRQYHSDKGDGKENLTLSPSVHRKAATDAFLARFNSSESQDEVSVCLYETQSPLKHSGFPQNVGQSMRYNEVNKQRLGIARSPNHRAMPYQGLWCSEDGNSGVSQAQSFHQNPELMFNRKAFSSTSVQNVNAVALLPHNLDGTTDNGKGSKSILTLVGKVISPRSLRRTTANGGA